MTYEPDGTIHIAYSPEMMIHSNPLLEAANVWTRINPEAERMLQRAVVADASTMSIDSVDEKLDKMARKIYENIKNLVDLPVTEEEFMDLLSRED